MSYIYQHGCENSSKTATTDNNKNGTNTMNDGINTNYTTHVRCARVRLEEAGDSDGVLLLLLHSEVHRLHSSQQQPRVERAQPGAFSVLVEVDLTSKARQGKIRRRGRVRVVFNDTYYLAKNSPKYQVFWKFGIANLASFCHFF